MNTRPTKKNNRKLSGPSNAKKVAERAMSRVLEEKSGIADTLSAGLGRKNNIDLDNILSAHPP
jgi:hypothetical protein